MKESSYQKKIINSIIANGGKAFTGHFPKAQADIVAMLSDGRYIEIEVKTPENYERVMKCVVEESGLYSLLEGIKGLKPHEPAQIMKLNKTRRLGGLALLAHSYEQVQEYVHNTP